MRLYVLDVGTLDVDRGAILTPGDGAGEWIAIGIPGYLVQADDGRTILIDSGMPPAYVADPIAAGQADRNRGVLRARVAPDHLPAAQLAKIGLTPRDVTHHVITHTHIDHAGGLGSFPQAVHVVQRAERELPRPLYSRLAWPEDVTYQVVEGDAELAPGMQLLATPGHTPGHMSVLLHLPQTGPVLLAIDAIYLPAVLDTNNFKASWNEALARASGHRVARLARETGARLIYGHDPAQWATLRKAPAYYE